MRLFVPRVTTILALAPLSSQLSPHLTATISAWEQAKELATFRNRVAHSPLMLGWADDSKVGPPTLLTLVDFKADMTIHDSTATISLDALRQKINEVAICARRVRSLYRAIWHNDVEHP
jgi:hypothetical protein